MSLRTFAASGGFGAKTYTLSAGNEGGYFSINATSGVLSVVMNAPAGVYTLSVQVSDSRDFSAEVRIIAQVVVVRLWFWPIHLFIGAGRYRL